MLIFFACQDLEARVQPWLYSKFYLSLLLVIHKFYYLSMLSEIKYPKYTLVLP